MCVYCILIVCNNMKTHPHNVKSRIQFGGLLVENSYFFCTNFNKNKTYEKCVFIFGQLAKCT